MANFDELGKKRKKKKGEKENSATVVFQSR